MAGESAGEGGGDGKFERQPAIFFFSPYMELPCSTWQRMEALLDGEPRARRDKFICKADDQASSTFVKGNEISR